MKKKSLLQDNLVGEMAELLVGGLESHYYMGLVT